MKKFVITSLIIVLIISSGFPNLAFANTAPIKVFVNGVELQTDQPPIIRNGRTLVPLRAIFEALNARVIYDEGSRKITATRDDTRIVLYTNFTTAVVNNKQVPLDVPATVVNGRTLVPVRFVSEALGDRVTYNATTRQVLVTRKAQPIGNVTARDIADFGDGRDLEVTFRKADNETTVHEYRIMVVKTSKADKFDLNAALGSSHFTVVPKTGRDIRQVLSSTTLDTDGARVEDDISYTIFVLQLGLGSRPENFIAKSTPITLTMRNRVPAITNLQVRDVADFGDGRDIEVSFTKIADESRLLHYRAIVVPSSDVNQFSLSAAKEVASSNYTIIDKTGTNIRQTLTSQRDYRGRMIQNNVPYQVFILSIGNSSMGFGSAISAPSTQLTLRDNPNDIRATNVVGKDISDFGDGRDLEVSFKIPAHESRVFEYRIMIVPALEVNSFTLDKANNVPGTNYTTVTKNGRDQTVALTQTKRDVNGNLIRQNVAYRIFVLSIGGPSNGFSNSLSSPSQSITLTDNFRTASVSSLRVFDVSDHGDGRDLQVNFNRITDESNLLEYRIMVVKSAQAPGFNLSEANNVTAANYTAVPKTGNNVSRNLTAHSHDAFGEIIREGVEYRVFVLSVSNGGNPRNNVLSGASAAITLRPNAMAQAVINVTAHDVGNAADASDMEVRFIRIANEAAISEYRIMVVRENQTFNIDIANTIPASNYTAVAKTGSNIVHRMSPTARDVNGDPIVPDISYRVFVLSVSNSASTNGLSNPSAPITLSNPIAAPVTNIVATDLGNNGNGRDMRVTFNPPANETNIVYYEILVVRESEASSFDLAAANLIPKEYTTRVSKTGNNLSVTLSATTRDVRGNLIANNIEYRVFVLSIADGINATINGFASSASSITLN